MTDSEEDPEGDTPPETEPKSRFDDLFDRLAKRGSDDRSGDDSDGDRTDTEAGTVDPAPEMDDGDPAPDGWLWGSPNRASDATSVSGPDHRAEKQPPRPSEADTDRLWNTDPEELLDTGKPASKSGPAEENEGKTATPTEDDGSDEGTERASRRTERNKTPEPTETDSDRWAELGANLDSTDTDPSEPSEGRSSDPSGSADRSGNERRTGGSAEEPLWERTEAGASQNEELSGTASLPSDDHSAALDRVTDKASVLVLGPNDHPISDAICSRFLVGAEGSRNGLFVTFQDDPDDRIEVCHRAEDWTGGEIGVIEVGRGRRTAAATSQTTSSAGHGSITVRHVSRPGDLSKLGIVITQLLAEFDETSQQTVLCFHTLSALHSQVGTKTLFRFLNTLQGRLRTSNAVGHYHMNPDLHDEMVIETLRPIFDSVVRFSADGDLEIE